MNGELLRIVDALRREKNIDAEIVFDGIEQALVSAVKKHFGPDEEVTIQINRETGDIQATFGGQPMDPSDLGRIAAQAAKQVIIQKIREAERASLMEDYADQVGAIVSGQVTRLEHGNAVVSLGRGEGFLPRSEQVPGETLHIADRIRAIILDVRESGAGVRIVLSRSHTDLVVRLFELEVPEVADRVITIEAIAREPGHRTKVAVSSMDSRVDAVGACVGIRGSRIKNIVEEVAGEKIDIVRYNESPQVFIANALKPAEVKEILLNRDINRATVLVAEDQLSLAIGKKGQNVRLAARLTGWNIDIMTPAEYDQQRTKAVEQLSTLEAVGPDLAAELVAAGYISIADVAEVSPEVLARASGLDAEHAQRIVEQTAALVAELEARAAEERRAAEAEAAQAAEAPTQEAEASTETPAETVEATPETPDQEEAETVQTGPPGLGEPEGTEAEETTRPGQPPPEAEAPAGEPETTAGPAEHPPEAPGPDPAATEA